MRHARLRQMKIKADQIATSRLLRQRDRVAAATLEMFVITSRQMFGISGYYLSHDSLGSLVFRRPLYLLI